MQIVIDIPKNIIDTIQADEMISRDQLAVLQMHILNGKTLPKGHGRLIDADAIKYTHSIARSMDDGHNWNELCVTADEIADAPTVIETESEE